MSGIWYTFSTLTRLFCLRAKPADVPYSRLLLGIFATIFLLVDCITDIWFVDIVNNYDGEFRVYLSWYYSLSMSILWLLILYACVRTVLSHYCLTDRLVQVMTAFVWADLVLACIYLLGVMLLSQMTFPLSDSSVVAIGFMLAFIFYVYWQFMLYLHIIFNSLNISVIKAGIFALLYILAQYNIQEVLINFMVVEKPF